MPAAIAGVLRMQVDWKWLRFVLVTLMACAISGPGLAAEARYRVEVLVFRNAGSDATPEAVEALRDFHAVFELDEDQPPPVPVARGAQGQTFANLWSRLQRLEAYEPLAMLSWEQSQVDFHPPVRVHDEQVIDERPGPPLLVFQADPAVPALPVEPPMYRLYRLDGSVQLRRSRFLHIDLDLEYRIGEPAQSRNFVLGPAASASPAEAEQLVPIEPFHIHHLRQSRQVKPGEVHYFDSAWLGALVRVTALSD
jgi:hypothetical protein